MAKLLKVIVIHDLIEAEAGDVPVTEMMRNLKLLWTVTLSTPYHSRRARRQCGFAEPEIQSLRPKVYLSKL
ncbi:HD domain-containing protein [Dyadobacter sp. CY261]|nr:HD domain-containing protein [Dyadobacter sp. CY261]